MNHNENDAMLLKWDEKMIFSIILSFDEMNSPKMLSNFRNNGHIIRGDSIACINPINEINGREKLMKPWYKIISKAAFLLFIHQNFRFRKGGHRIFVN